MLSSETCWLQNSWTFPTRFSQVIVEDLEKEGGFDDAVQGVDAVLHTASPFHGNITTGIYEDLINPAVMGTKNVLSSIKKHGDKVKRVVVTSSFASGKLVSGIRFYSQSGE